MTDDVKNPKKVIHGNINWKCLGKDEYLNTDTGLKLFIESQPNGDFLAMGRMPNTEKFEMSEINMCDGFQSKDQLKNAMFDFMGKQR